MSEVLKQGDVSQEETQQLEAEAVEDVNAAEADITTEEVPVVEETPEEESVALETPEEVPVIEEIPVEESVALETPEEIPVVEETPVEESVALETPEKISVVEETPIESMADYEDNFDDANPWNVVKRYMDNKTNLTVTIESVVNGGALTNVEGLRAFIPASRLSLSYVEDLEIFLTKEMEVRVIDVDQPNNRLVLSAREILKEKENAEKIEQASSIKIGTIMEGVVETLQNYGAFVKLENGLSGLVHVSQISTKRIKTPSEVLKVGDEIKVKIIGLKDGKISLSLKALEEKIERAFAPKVDLPKTENIGTSLGDLFKNIDLK